MGSDPRPVSASYPWQSEKELGKIKGPACGGASSKRSPKLQEFVPKDPRGIRWHWIAPNGCCFCEFPCIFLSLEVFRMNRELWKGGLEVGWPLWAGPAPGVHSLVLWSSFVGRDDPNPHHQWSIPTIHKPLRASQTSSTSNHNLLKDLKVGVCNLSSHRTFSMTLCMAGNWPHLSFSLYPSMRKLTECPEYSRRRCRMEPCTAIIIFPASFSLPFLIFLFSTTQKIECLGFK